MSAQRRAPNDTQSTTESAIARAQRAWLPGAAVALSVNPGPIIGRAWKALAWRTRQRVLRRDGSANAWLNQHAGTKKRGLTAASQLGRMVAEMTLAGMSDDEIDRELLALVSSARPAHRAASFVRPPAA